MKTKTLFTICALASALNVLVSAGFSVAALHERHFSDQVAMYAVARSIPIAVAVIVAALRGSAALLVPLSFLAAAIQLCDAFVGMTGSDAQKIFGPLFLAAITAVSAASLHRRNTTNIAPPAPR